jgi:WD40-like Beta Propeller Repeat
MTSTHKTNRVLLGAAVLGLASIRAWAADEPIWSWHEAHTEIYSPSFSKSGDEIVLVRKKHTADFHEAEELPEAEKKKLSDPIKKNERYADPEVIVFKIGNNAAARVDWGWSPAFSPDGQQVVYAYQKKPISRLRVLAANLAGNDIRLFRRDTKAISVLATPASAYFSDPIFAPDGKQVAYSLSGAINGDWGGNIGIARVSIDGSGNEILYPATKDFELYHLIDSKRYIGDRLFALRWKPTSGGVHMAESYLYELLDVGPPTKAVYTWPTAKGSEEPMAFCSDAKGEMLVYDGGWHPITAAKSDRKPASEDETPGVPSPDGRLLARAGDDGLEILEFQSQKVVKTIKVRGGIESVTWSPGARRFAVVTTRYREGTEIFDHDEIAVYEL